jgi:hypothetical protein
MNSMRSTLATIRRSQTTLIAAAALCAAVLVSGSAAFASSRNSSSAAPASSTDTGKMAPTITAEEAAAKHQTLKFAAVIADGDFQNASFMTDGETKSYYGTWTVYPFQNTLLVSFVAYNEYCQEVTPGYWTEGSIGPKYGEVTQAHHKGRLSNGDCPGWIFTGAGVFYKWVHSTGSTHNDEFKANWHGAGLENKVTFYIKNR